jgi:hypothetical protein
MFLGWSLVAGDGENNFIACGPRWSSQIGKDRGGELCTLIMLITTILLMLILV